MTMLDLRGRCSADSGRQDLRRLHSSVSLCCAAYSGCVRTLQDPASADDHGTPFVYLDKRIGTDQCLGEPRRFVHLEG